MDIAGDIKLEDERGNIIDAKKIHIAEIIRLIDSNMSESELAQTFCLQFIEPYANTTFNELQTKFLIKEFGVLLENCQIKEDRETLKSIIEFISNNEFHTYIKFYGD